MNNRKSPSDSGDKRNFRESLDLGITPFDSTNTPSSSAVATAAFKTLGSYFFRGWPRDGSSSSARGDQGGSFSTDDGTSLRDAAPTPAPLEFPINLALIGERGSGKTSLTRRFVNNQFDATYQPPSMSLGAIFSAIKIDLLDDPTLTVKLRVWDDRDPGRSKQFQVPSYYPRQVDCAILVYDITQSTTLEKAPIHVQQFLQGAITSIVIGLCGNKSDLSAHRQVTQEEAKIYAEAEGLVWSEASAKTGEGVLDLFKAVAKKTFLTMPHVVEVLNKLPHAEQVACEHVRPPDPLDLAGDAILTKITHWNAQKGNNAVYWLKGGEGTGKTEILLSFSRYIKQDSTFLTASFVCAPHERKRSDVNLIFPTLARQLADEDSDFRIQLFQIIRRIPDVAQLLPVEQFKRLIVEPLRESVIDQRPVILIIDAVDECRDSGATDKILHALTEHITSVPFLKVLMSSRTAPFWGNRCSACLGETESK